MSNKILILLLGIGLTGCKSTDIQSFQQAVSQATTNIVNNANNKPQAKKSKQQQTANRLSIVDTISGVHLLDDGQTRELIEQDYQIITPEAFATLERAEKETRLKQDMDTLGFGVLNISNTFNKVQQTALVYAKQQYDLIESYNTLALNHRDVQSFLRANQGKSEKELSLAIAEFDKGAKKPSEKIAPKIKAYEKANQQIFNKNAELTAIITLQVLELGTVVLDDPSQFLKMEGLLLLANYYKVEKASSILMDRLTLAQHANTLIADDKALIDITKQIQLKQNQRAQPQRK
ncbi:hypothetical protein [Catenovulum agarivorans]|uniref:hypothetical protein n=1 Tax=Catenovulum agarivorans TaxID=1172192 RepID=UPI0002E46FDB|nr:hypothetical protein [Catenovulum agarivorans]